ncbi:MAG: CoA-binding protein [Deltaproteobacteria bacterium]|nr:CoA-binding protein [Deltaproteobacteria bacterium]
MKTDFAKLDRAFNPRTIVVVGDKGDNKYLWLTAQSEFKGALYSVQIAPQEFDGIAALGVKNFTSLMDVPDPIDLAIVSVPRVVAPRVLDDCIQKGVAAAHFFTSGFAETSTKEGINLEKILIEKSQAANFHLIGPNCMGIYNPRVGVKQSPIQYSGIAGPIGLISQSGTHAINFSIEAHLHGLNISKSVSFGNGIILDSADYLEYFAQDKDIEAIGIYIEGPKDGQRFFRVLKETAARKPVVIWKGGRTDAGSRAIASHTGALAAQAAVWDAAVRQCGAVTAANMEELIDILKAIIYLRPVKGDRVAITGGSGGLSVAVADAFAEAGLQVPRLTRKSYDEFASFFSLIGGGYQNPVDTGNANSREMKRILSILEADDNIDNIVLLLTARYKSMYLTDQIINATIDMRNSTSKPVAAILSYSFSAEYMEKAQTLIKKLQDGGIPTFVSLERGALALKKTLEYYRSKNSQKTE